MNFLKSLLSIVFLFTLLFAVPNAQAEWWITDGEEDILLDCVDDALVNDPANPDPSIPWHRIDAGTYGYWEGTTWIEVITDGVIHTAYENCVEWIPGTLDYNPIS